MGEEKATAARNHQVNPQPGPIAGLPPRYGLQRHGPIALSDAFLALDPPRQAEIDLPDQYLIPVIDPDGYDVRMTSQNSFGGSRND